MIDNITRILMSSSDGEGGNGGVSGSDIALYIIIGVVAVAVIGMIIFTNISRKKQAKKNDEQRNSLVPGDVIETVGGIIGTILAVRNAASGKEFIIETGEEGRKTTLTVDIMALYRVISQKNPPTTEVKSSDGKSSVEVVGADVEKPDENVSVDKKDK